MTNVQILCINKSDRFDPWARIKHIGGQNPDGSRWRLTLEAAIAGIRAGKWQFWVAGNPSVWVEIALSRFGNEYLKTEADGETPDNLLSLPECPA